MGRVSRNQAPDTFQHVTARGDSGEPIFLDDHDREAFLHRLAAETVESQWTLLSYCLMSNHVHLLLRLGDRGISTGMHAVLNSYAHRFNAAHEHDGHVFGNRFHARVVDEGYEDEDDLPAVFRYIAWNPCEAGIVASPDEWRWSAHRALLGLAPPAGGLNVHMAHGCCEDGLRGYRDITSRPPKTLEELLTGPLPIRRAVARGHTQTEIAAALGIGQASVSRRLQAERGGE